MVLTQITQPHLAQLVQQDTTALRMQEQLSLVTLVITHTQAQQLVQNVQMVTIVMNKA